MSLNGKWLLGSSSSRPGAAFKQNVLLVNPNMWMLIFSLKRIFFRNFSHLEIMSNSKKNCQNKIEHGIIATRLSPDAFMANTAPPLHYPLFLFSLKHLCVHTAVGVECKWPWKWDCEMRLFLVQKNETCVYKPIFHKLSEELLRRKDI